MENEVIPGQNVRRNLSLSDSILNNLSRKKENVSNIDSIAKCEKNDITYGYYRDLRVDIIFFTLTLNKISNMRSRYLYRKLASFDIPTRDNIHRYECNTSIILSHCFLECFCLLELMSVNSKSHVGTLPPFYETLTQNEDVMTSNTYLKYNHPS